MATIKAFVLAAAMAGALWGGGPPVLATQIPDETVPPGGMAQIKVSLDRPHALLTGRLTMKFDPAVFGDIASAAVFSATGDAIGFAKIDGRELEAQFTSPAGGVGRLRGVPVLTVAVPVLPECARGTELA